VNGVKGDNLHKLGEGTLLVSAKGVNEGGLKVGDGITILNQKADERGNIQAFSSVNIASGRPSVILGDNKQINPDNIAWGYRGGVLDINGND
ncbi:S6 family peptidase, partial [Klebsiella pneumoniae]